ncbi:MAG: methyltransferase domain-containing protein [Pseudomonadota bacterium]
MSRDLVRRQFGANAANYVASPVHAKGKSLDRLVTLTEPKSSWRVLDVATATGHTAFAFAPHVASVVASDLTPEMLDQARAQADERNLTNVSFELADAEELAFAADSFDLVTCRIAPHHFPDCGAFVDAVARVLKPGGVFALCDNISPDEETPTARNADDARASAVAYNAFEALRDPSHHRALSTREWTDLCGKSGLEVRHLEFLDKAMAFNRWCDTMSVASDTRESLRSDLAERESPLASFIRPTPVAGDDIATADDIGFTLTELVLIAQKPADVGARQT